MKVIFVHGINNEHLDSDKIKEIWGDLLKKTSAREYLFDGFELVAPFYGKRLAELSKPAAGSVKAVAQGDAPAVPEKDAKFAAELLEEIARDLEVSDAEISELKGSEPAQQGPILDYVLHPLLRLIEKKFPGAGDIALSFVQQANTYFNTPGVREEIDEMVAPSLRTNESQIVIGHSLGSVVTYSVLRELETKTALYLTLGSPLSLLTIRRKLGPPKVIPKGVELWANGIDPSDPVGLGNDLANTKFVKGIQPIKGINNGFGLKAHSIHGYLSNTDVAQHVVSAIQKIKKASQG